MVTTTLNYDFKLAGYAWSTGWNLAWFQSDNRLMPSFEAGLPPQGRYDLSRYDGGVFLTLPQSLRRSRNRGTSDHVYAGAAVAEQLRRDHRRVPFDARLRLLSLTGAGPVDETGRGLVGAKGHSPLKHCLLLPESVW